MNRTCAGPNASTSLLASTFTIFSFTQFSLDSNESCKTRKLSHSIWKSLKKPHSILRVKWTTLTFWDFLVFFVKKGNLDCFVRNKKYDKPCNKLKVNASYFVTRRPSRLYGREYVVKICVVHEASLCLLCLRKVSSCSSTSWLLPKMSWPYFSKISHMSKPCHNGTFR